MTQKDDNRFFLPAWGVSLALHGAVVGLAFAFVAQIRPVLPEDLFQWDVALVEAAKSDSVPDQARSVESPVQPPAKVASQPHHKPVERRIEPLQPTIESVPPIEQKVEMPEVRNESVEQRLVTATEPTAESEVENDQSRPVEAQPIQAESVAVATAPPSVSDVSLSQQVSEPTLAPIPTIDAAPVQEARAAVPGPEVRLDHRWLAESLWRRVAELKRYPSMARMNGQEGKVIVKAVIRSDGQLADVFVQKSSGYSALDQAAMDAVRLACPLHMKHAIGKPQIVVSLPIVYSLAN